MTTISVPLSEEILKDINDLIKRGVASNKAELVRQALQMYIDEQAVEAVLRAADEPSLRGDLDTLASKL